MKSEEVLYHSVVVYIVQELLKYSSGCKRVSELQGALTAMLDLLKSVNDSMHQIAITGYEVSTVHLHFSVVCRKTLLQMRENEVFNIEYDVNAILHQHCAVFRVELSVCVLV